MFIAVNIQSSHHAEKKWKSKVIEALYYIRNFSNLSTSFNSLGRE